jgi:hypothetical protein
MTFSEAQEPFPRTQRLFMNVQTHQLECMRWVTGPNGTDDYVLVMGCHTTDVCPFPTCAERLHASGMTTPSTMCGPCQEITSVQGQSTFCQVAAIMWLLFMPVSHLSGVFLLSGSADVHRAYSGTWHAKLVQQHSHVALQVKGGRFQSTECLALVHLTTSREDPNAVGVSELAQAALAGGRMTSLCAAPVGQRGFGAAGAWHVFAGSKSGELSAVRVTIPSSPHDQDLQVS